MKPDAIIYYCKSLKDTGKPIIVNMGKRTINTDEVVLNNVNIIMKFNNSKGAAKRSGATTVLEVFKNE